ncbi:hypothetical protein B0T14DRAFT_290812 [Immersiella caudata]|uniref:Secreted protein n=1 Tax=Immersiella caudata TaxID=314043 RepID=A0AA40BUA2_9PEZI|nr:hypothetical protein B0T14DRAFT_290812 [Immersiella caudata]
MRPNTTPNKIYFLYFCSLALAWIGHPTKQGTDEHVPCSFRAPWRCAALLCIASVQAALSHDQLKLQRPARTRHHQPISTSTPHRRNGTLGASVVNVWSIQWRPPSRRRNCDGTQRREFGRRAMMPGRILRGRRSARKTQPRRARKRRGNMQGGPSGQKGHLPWGRPMRARCLDQGTLEGLLRNAVNCPRARDCLSVRPPPRRKTRLRRWLCCDEQEQRGVRIRGFAVAEPKYRELKLLCRVHH